MRCNIQTFLPLPDFHRSAVALDPVRLRNQRRECKSILTSIETQSGWYNHPATQMWIGYEQALIQYSIVICQQCLDRLYKDTQLLYFKLKVKGSIVIPWWFGKDEFHASHRSNLLRKDPIWYKHFKWKEPDDLQYYWPTQHEDDKTNQL